MNCCLEIQERCVLIAVAVSILKSSWDDIGHNVQGGTGCSGALL